MALIQSNSCLFQVKLDGVYTTVMCLRSFSLNPSTTEKEITPPGNGKFKSFDYKQISYTVSLDGVLYREDNVNPVIFSFAEYQKNFIEVPFRALYKDEANQYKVVTGQAIVRNCNIEVSAGQIGSGTVELLGQGEYVTADMLPEFVNLRIHTTGSPTAQALFQFRLINADGEAVFQTDQLPQASGGNLANPIDITVPVPKGLWYYWFNISTEAIGNQMVLNAPPGKTSAFNIGLFNESSFPTQLYDFTANRDLDIQLGVNNPPPTCVPPLIASSNIPDGTSNIAWNGTVNVSGSQPFTVTNVTKPVWMNIAINGGVISLSGTPTSGINQTISFDVTNACGTVSFSDTFNISSNPSSIFINWDYSEDGGTPSQSIFLIFVNGVQAVGQNTTGTGTLVVNPGDFIEARVIGPVLIHKTITVSSSFGVIDSQTGAGSIVVSSFSPNAIAQPYSIIATSTF